MLWAARQSRQFDGDVAKVLAEREGFEPPIPVKVCPLSRRIVSTAHAPLRKAAVSYQPVSFQLKGPTAPCGLGKTPATGRRIFLLEPLPEPQCDGSRQDGS